MGSVLCAARILEGGGVILRFQGFFSNFSFRKVLLINEDNMDKINEKYHLCDQINLIIEVVTQGVHPNHHLIRDFMLIGSWKMNIFSGAERQYSFIVI